MEMKNISYDVKSSFAFSALEPSVQKKVIRRLKFLAAAKRFDFMRERLLTVMGRPDRHLVGLTSGLIGVVVRGRQFRVVDIFHKDQVKEFCRSKGMRGDGGS